MQVCTRVCGKMLLIASGKPFSPSTTAIRMSPTPRTFRSFMTLSQNLAPSGLLDPKAEHVLVAAGFEAQRDVDGLVLHRALVADFDPERVEEDHGIDRLERAALPVAHLVEHRIGHPQACGRLKDESVGHTPIPPEKQLPPPPRLRNAPLFGGFSADC